MPYNIEVSFDGGLTRAQKDAFQEAANRWSQIITADVPAVRIGEAVVDDLLISARGVRIDGVGGTLGRATPLLVRPNSGLPITGEMEFDTSDLARMEADGSLISVIIHEMGHVLGLGTIWHGAGLVRGTETANPVFIGTNAQREFGHLIGATGPVPVPLANQGGRGTREGHWRESVFGNELMTGFLNPGVNPLSRLTAAALIDLGYSVDVDAADPFELPTPLGLALMGVDAERPREICCMAGQHGRSSGPTVVPDDWCQPKAT